MRRATETKIAPAPAAALVVTPRQPPPSADTNRSSKSSRSSSAARACCGSRILASPATRCAVCLSWGGAAAGGGAAAAAAPAWHSADNPYLFPSAAPAGAGDSSVGARAGWSSLLCERTADTRRRQAAGAPAQRGRRNSLFLAGPAAPAEPAKQDAVNVVLLCLADTLPPPRELLKEEPPSAAPAPAALVEGGTEEAGRSC